METFTQNENLPAAKDIKHGSLGLVDDGPILLISLPIFFHMFCHIWHV